MVRHQALAPAKALALARAAMATGWDQVQVGLRDIRGWDLGLAVSPCLTDGYERWRVAPCGVHSRTRMSSS